MGKEQIKVIHIDTEKSWRGGQQQAVYLFEGMLERGYDTLMLCPPGSAMQAYCQDNHLPFQPLHCAHELDFGSGKDTAKIAGIYSASILQLHSGHSVSCGLWAKLFNRKLKLVATRRVDFSIKKNPFSALKYNTRLLDHIVCISEEIRQVLLRDGVAKHKLSVIHSGIDTHRFDGIEVSADFRQRWGIPENALLVGTVAAFAGHKDYPNFLKAVLNICKARQDVWFMAMGEGELLEPMKQLATELKISDRIIFTGFQSNVGEFLKAFDIFVLASKKEGLGTSVLDAMSVGSPIVATRAGGIPEMIKDKENGLLVNTGDSDALSQAVLHLLDNPHIA
ncbi:MAG: glycosyltransferase, partial [Candidatus Cloacimonadaceae bacterium]